MTQVVVTFPQHRGTQKIKETLLFRERAILPIWATQSQMDAEEQRIAGTVIERVRVLCETHRIIPDAGERPMPLGLPQDRFEVIDAEPAGTTSDQLLAEEETHSGIPNESLQKQYVTPKIIQVFGN